MRQYHLVIVSVTINVLFFLLYIFFGIVQHGSLDDYFMSGVLTGAYGSSYDVHTFFVNSAYGYFLRPFYWLFPQVGWYFIFELIGTFTAFISICFVLIKKMGTRWGVPLSLLILAALAPDFYFQISFTQCATLYTAAGMLLFVAGDSSKNKKLLIGGGILFIAGSVMRWECFLLGLPFIGVLLASNIYNRKTLWKVSVVALGIILITIAGLKTHEKNLYTQEDYQYYADYQSVRAFLGDGAFYDFESTYDELEERGMSGKDFRLLKRWMMYDTEKFCIDSLRPVVNVCLRNKYAPNWERMPIAFLMAVSVALTRANGWCWVIFCILLMLTTNKKANWYPWVSLSLIAISLAYLLLVNRLVYRVETGVWLYGIVGAIPFLPRNFAWKNNIRFQKAFVSVMCVVVPIFAIWTMSSQELKTQWKLIETKEMTPDWSSFVEHVQRHPNQVFLLPFDRYKQLGTLKDKPYKSVTPGSWQNIIPLGYWNIHLPAMKSELAKRGVLNPIKDIVKPNVFVVGDKDVLSLPDYYLRHYDKSLIVDTVSTFGKICLLKYRIAETVK